MSYQELFGLTAKNQKSNVTEFASADAMESANQTLLNELAALDREIERSETTLDALDGIQMFAANFGAPKSEAEKVLFGMNVMQSFGGQVAFDELAGNSMESMDDQDSFDYSMESLKDKAVSIYQWIREQVMKLYAVIEQFFYNLLGGIPKARKAIRKLRARAEAAAGKTADEKKFDLNDRDQDVLTLSDNTKISKGGDLEGHTGMLADVLDAADKEYYSKLEQYSKDLKGKLEDADVEQGIDLKAFNDTMRGSDAVKAINPSAAKLFGINSTNLPAKGYDNKSGKMFPLISGKSVFVTATKTSGSNSVEVAERNISLVAEVKATNPSAKKVTGGSFEILTPGEVENLCDNLEKLCDSIESISRGAEKGNINKAKKALDKAGNKLDGAYKKAKDRTGDDKLDADKITAARLSLKFIKQYANMVAKPVPQIIATATTFMNTTMGVANKSLSQYK